MKKQTYTIVITGMSIMLLLYLTSSAGAQFAPNTGHVAQRQIQVVAKPETDIISKKFYGPVTRAPVQVKFCAEGYEYLAISESTQCQLDMPICRQIGNPPKPIIGGFVCKGKDKPFLDVGAAKDICLAGTTAVSSSANGSPNGEGLYSETEVCCAFLGEPEQACNP
ncbi:MAG: hypothetical protein WC956_09185 [bacterium]